MESLDLTYDGAARANDKPLKGFSRVPGTRSIVLFESRLLTLFGDTI